MKSDTDKFCASLVESRNRCYSTAYSMLGNADDARDATQDALLQALRHRDQLNDYSRLAPWLQAITVRVCLMRLRKQVPVRVAADVPTTDAWHVVDVKNILIRQALDRISPHHREILTLFYMREYSLKEISEELQIPESTVKSRLRNARAKLVSEWDAGVDDRIVTEGLPPEFATQLSEVLAAAAAGDEAAVARQIRRDPRLLRARSFFGSTAATTARRSGHLNLARELESRRHDNSLPDAAESGNLDAVRAMLVSDPRRVDEVSPAGFTALCLAAHYGFAEIVVLLLAHGAAVNKIASSAVGVAPLHSCLFAGQYEIAVMLMDHNADVNLPRTGTPDQERTGWTALHYAAACDHGALFSAMVSHGGDVAIRDARGRTARDIAIEYGSNAVLGIIDGPSPREAR